MIVGADSQSDLKVKPDAVLVVRPAHLWGLQFYAGETPLYRAYFDSEEAARICAGQLVANHAFKMRSGSVHE
jgi:hypothetical protein